MSADLDNPGSPGRKIGPSPSAHAAVADEARRLAGLVLLRVLVTSALFGAALATSIPEAASGTIRGSLYAFLIAAYAGSALEFVWLLGRRRIHLLAWGHLVFETALAGWLVALTGGPTGAFSFLLLLSTVHGALAAGSLGAFTAASLATVSLAALGAGVPLPLWLAPFPVDPSGLSHLAPAVFANAGGCFATAALASYLTERLQRAGRALSVKEEELQSLGELYRSVVQSLGSGLLTLSGTPAGPLRVTLLNEAGAQILGVSATEAWGREVDSLAPGLSAALRRFPTGEGRGECEVDRGGRRLLLGFSVSPWHGVKTEPIGRVVAFEDVTKLRRLEASVRRQGHLASLGELSAGLAHEIRNPLAALSGAVQMLSASPATEEDGKLFELVQRETSHLGKLVSDFLDFARPPPPAPRDLDLGALAEACCASFRADGVGARRELRCEVRAKAIVRADPDQLRQVFGNLLRNAGEATAEGGRIEVVVGPSEDGALLEVSDDGPGIAPEAARNLFEPFFTTKEKGTGLGLALVARIVGAHEGAIDVDRGPLGGVRFTVTLPRATLGES